MAEDTRLEDRPWAIVTTGGGRRYLGVLDAEALTVVKESSSKPCWMWLKPAYELAVMTRQVAVGPQQIAIQRECRLFPIDRCFEDARVRVHNPPEIALLEEDVSKADFRHYMSLVRALQEELVAARAQDSGIALPNTKLPPGFDPRGGHSGRA